MRMSTEASGVTASGDLGCGIRQEWYALALASCTC